MTPKDLRDLISTSPFHAFRLHLVDGKSLRVPHQDFILIGASMMVVASELPDGSPGELNLLTYEHIARVEFLPRKTRKAA